MTFESEVEGLPYFGFIFIVFLHTLFCSNNIILLIVLSYKCGFMFLVPSKVNNLFCIF